MEVRGLGGVGFLVSAGRGHSLGRIYEVKQLRIQGVLCYLEVPSLYFFISIRQFC